MRNFFLARNGCLTSNCDANASCRHGPTGWGCTCNCGYEGDGYNCKKLDATLNCVGEVCDCRKGWEQRPHHLECKESL